MKKIKTEGLIDTYQISFSDNTTFEYTISNGSTDYLNITNKPSIKGVELTGDKTFKDLNIASAEALTATDKNLQNLSDLIGDKTSLPTPTNTVVNNIASVDAKVDAIIDDNETGLTKTFSSDKITKTFATLEEANKRILQYDVLPAPTEVFGGKVVQFIGATTEDYIHNYFYECVQVEGNYKWVNTVVQNVPTKVSELTNDNSFITETELNEKGYLTEHQDISGKVDKEEGKSLIADFEITRLSTVKNYDDSVVKKDIATIKTDYATKTYVGEQIAAADHLKREIVTEIPTVETATENVIYMLKVESAIGADKYKEYMLIDGEVACVGDTSVDLTDYAKKSEIPTELPANGGNAATVGGHTVGVNVPSNAKFTDTWRPVVDSLTSTATDSSLSANQGKVLNDKISELSNYYQKKSYVHTVDKDGSSTLVIPFPYADTAIITIYLNGVHLIEGVDYNIMSTGNIIFQHALKKDTKIEFDVFQSVAITDEDWTKFQPPIDTVLSSTSENPVQNKVINAAINNKQDKNCYIYNVKYMEFLVMENRTEIKWKISDTEAYLVQFLNDGHIGYFHSTDGEQNWQTIFIK